MEEKSLLDLIIEDLSTELSMTDEDFNIDILTSKVNQAYREVKIARKYPSHYTDDMIKTDIENYYSNIRNIALYDYNQLGAEFQSGHSESQVGRTWIDRDKLFSGIYPLSKL